MKMQENNHRDIDAVYCLHDDNCEKYTWMTYGSVLSLRYMHPEVNVLCFMPESTYRVLKKSAHPLLGEVQVEIIAVPRLECDNKISRYLKIASGTHVKKPFIFLDCDTLVVRPIKEPIEEYDIAATPDKNDKQTGSHVPEWVKPHYSSLNWTVNNPNYYNSGVVVYGKNTHDCHFFDKWLENWHSTCGLGFHNDQPSFNYTICDLGLRVKEMDDNFNAMVQVDENYIKNAIIMHFYSSTWSERRSKYDDLINDLRAGRISSGRKIFQRAVKWNDIYYDPTKINLLINKRYNELAGKLINKFRIKI